MILIMTMRIIVKIMNSSRYLRVLYKIASPVLLQELINDFAVCKHWSGKVVQRCSVKSILRNFAKFTENICVRVSFLKVCLKTELQFYLNSWSYSEINSVFSNKWALHQPQYFLTFSVGIEMWHWTKMG